MQYTYSIQGMHCASCIKKIQAALSEDYKVTSITLEPPQLSIESTSKPVLATLNKRIAKAGDYHLLAQPLAQEQVMTQEKPASYYPIILIILYIFGVSVINNIHGQSIDWLGWMNQFMAGFFLVFSAFKLLDIKGFAEGYATYDLLAKRWYGYGFIYPFLELGLGVLYLINWFPIGTPILTIIIMGFSTLGVINSLLKKQAIRCACLGTVINVPLSTITLIEDLGMVVMAALMLIMR